MVNGTNSFSMEQLPVAGQHGPESGPDQQVDHQAAVLDGQLKSKLG